MRLSRGVARAGLVLLLLVGGLPAGISAASAQPAPTASASDRTDPFRLRGEFTQGGWAIGTLPAGTSGISFDGSSIPVDRDGAFLIAFDRDASPQEQLVATRSDGSRVTRTLSISPRSWQISRLNKLPRFPMPQPEFIRLRQPELDQIAAARARPTDADGWRQRFIWPVTGRISTRFGSQRIYAGEPGAYHSGLDIARPTGTPIVAPADGVVILATPTPFTLEGRLLMIDHGAGLNSAFLHLSRIDVRVGDHVRQGQTIGAVGATGRAQGAHLHWGMKWRDARIDPLLFAGPMPAGG
jgi:murein DD-endopeptidase MepM/ murein hydrolase activator NlpD